MIDRSKDFLLLADGQEIEITPAMRKEMETGPSFPHGKIRRLTLAERAAIANHPPRILASWIAPGASRVAFLERRHGGHCFRTMNRADFDARFAAQN